MSRFLVPASLVLLMGFAVGDGHAQDRESLPVVWEVSAGILAPESVYYDAASGFLFVSNIGGGGPLKKDGDGYISQLTLDGKVVQSAWVRGLNAPKGLRSHAGTLWVSDIDRLVGMNIAQGKIIHEVAIPGAKFLNDVDCGPDGAVYVSDTLTSKIYRYLDGKVTVFAEGDELECPNGVLVEGGRLLVAAWGLSSDLAPKIPGRLFALDLKTKKKTLITKEPAGNLDGLEADGAGGYLVTDYLAGKVLRVAADGTTTVILKLAAGTADHAYLANRKLLIVPRMNDNKITAFRWGP